nr:hypothetical protein [candidate division Zixibacteria bacterium]
MRRILVYILSALLLPLSAFAADDGGTESPFVMGAGAGDLSLGGANQADNTSATAPFWNPAGMARTERMVLSGFHSRLYDDQTAYQYFGLVLPILDWGTIGLGVFRLGIDGIEKRDADNLLLGEFNDSRMAYYLAYGRNLAGYDIGAAVTFEHQSLDEYSATSSPGLNLSIGRRLNLGSGRLRELNLAVNLRNLVQPGLQLSEQSINYPTAFDLAVALGAVPFNNENHKTTLSGRLTKAESVSARFAAGLEYSLHDLVHLRGGVRDGRLSVGGGLSYKGFDFDYALVDRDLGNLHMFSISMAIGKTISDRERIRAERREADFNTMMNTHLNDRNNRIVSDLEQSGKQSYDEGRLVEAADFYDRALFLARTAGIDTTAIRRMAKEIHDRLQEVTIKMRYSQYMDSAQAKMNIGDYLAARYFGQLALGEIDNSSDARNLISEADRAIERIASEKEMIDSRLLVIDSLLSYGQLDRAAVEINTLRQYAPDNPRVNQAMRRVSFQIFREKAVTAFDRGDHRETIAALDSALVLFPEHRWCLEMRDRAVRELNQPARQTPPAGRGEAPVLSTELLREVESAYRTARKMFEQGDLEKAIEKWEEVERLAPDYQSVRDYLVKAYKFVGVELYGQSRLQEAIDIWKKAALIDPENEEIKDYIKRSESEIRKLEELSYGR